MEKKKTRVLKNSPHLPFTNIEDSLSTTLSTGAEAWRLSKCARSLNRVALQLPCQELVANRDLQDKFVKNKMSASKQFALF